MKKNDFTQL